MYIEALEGDHGEVKTGEVPITRVPRKIAATNKASILTFRNSLTLLLC